MNTFLNPGVLVIVVFLYAAGLFMVGLMGRKL